MPPDTRPAVIVGAGGHARVVLDMLRCMGMAVHGLTDSDPEAARRRLPQESILGPDDALAMLACESVALTIGVGSTRSTAKRRELFERFRARGYFFFIATHPAAVIAADAMIEDGAQIMAGAIVQSGARIGANVVVNTRASVDHDCVLAKHCFISPGVTLSGGVHVGEGAHIGAGATVIEGVRIGDGALVGAGALVLADVPTGVTVAGVPARTLPTSRGGRKTVQRG